jgi:diguanylate cyclase (GGDEF)-like protein/PAS domain S-box-containing protein
MQAQPNRLPAKSGQSGLSDLVSGPDDLRVDGAGSAPGTLATTDTEFRPDWDQLGVPILALGNDGRLLKCNRSFVQLARSSGVTTSAHQSQWLQLWTVESRALLFAALADRRAAVAPLGWVGAALAGAGPNAHQVNAMTAGAANAPVQRWYSASLRWRQAGSYCIAVLHDVTLVRHAELSARAQADQLRSMANCASMLVAYYDAVDLRCLYANRGYARAHGHDENAVLGRTLADIVGPDAARMAQPAIEQVMRTRQATSYDQWLPGAALAALGAMPTRAGRDVEAAINLDVNLAPHLDTSGAMVGLIVTMNDVTRFRETERAAAETEERLARFMQAGVEGIVFHREGVIADANPAFCDLLGYTLHDLLGRDLIELVSSDQRQRLTRILASNEERRIETTMQPREGKRIAVEFITRHVLQDGVPMHLAVLRDVRERHAAQERLHFLAHHDALTGLPNRQSFMSQLEQMMVRASTAKTELALMFIDLDAFRRVNDSLGHSAGDARLKTVARRISENLRSTDKVARFGGDEFMVLLPSGRDRIDLPSVAAKIQAAVSAPLDIEGGSVSVTASIGIAVFPNDGETPDALIRHADAAMHRAKANGSAGYAFFEPEHANSAYAELVLESQLASAIEQEEFTLVFQPQVDSSGLTVGAEALIRWRHPQRGLLAPDEFIELAEQHRLMLPIGAWVLRAAAQAARQWYEVAGKAALSVAVNLSTLQFKADDFVGTVAAVLAESGLPRGWLEFELTERMLVDDLPSVCQRLAELRALGVRVSIDDFGTGYSSLGHLKNLPVDKLKIDRSFVSELPGGRHSGAIVSAIVQLSHSLDLVVVAEGVETAAQRRFLCSLGCDVMQGMGISPPLDAEQMLAWLHMQARAQHTLAAGDPSDILLRANGGIF